MKPKKTFLGSSSTREGILKVIKDFYYASTISLVQQSDPNKFEVHNANGIIEDCYVEFHKEHFKFWIIIYGR